MAEGRILLPLLTLLHLTVDGACGAALAAYATAEPDFEPILFHFSLYNLIAFGGQWLTGWLLDWRPRWMAPALVLSLLLLAAGSYPAVGIFRQAVLLGLGNCVFHAAGGGMVLRRFAGYLAPGIFVSSGAIGLGLGLASLVGPVTFLALDALATAGALFCLRRGTSDAALPCLVFPAGAPVLPGVLLLVLLCVILRGFGGGGAVTDSVMLFPCVFAAGKALGGLLGDRLGYRRIILLLFLLGFLALQAGGLIGAVALALAFNMAMPLTLCLAYRCLPRFPGLAFGLAAGCLLPGVFFGRTLFIPSAALVTLQFLGLSLAGWLLARQGVDERWEIV
ncbi:MAG: hypothetical protein IJS96_09230 [Schwartzia sp.]|nr:hypothetical protein [Schwartzia sp. (in: firmicutes)]